MDDRCGPGKGRTSAGEKQLWAVFAGACRLKLFLKISESLMSSNIKIHWNSDNELTNNQLVSLLNELGELLPDPLSKRVNIFEYSQKIISNADIACMYVQDKIVGIVAIYTNDNQYYEAFVSFLGIFPSVQRRGLGKILMSEAISYAKEKGMQIIKLKVHKNNYSAQKFYASYNFDYDRIDNDKIIMYKKI